MRNLLTIQPKNGADLNKSQLVRKLKIYNNFVVSELVNTTYYETDNAKLNNKYYKRRLFEWKRQKVENSFHKPIDKKLLAERYKQRKQVRSKKQREARRAKRQAVKRMENRIERK